MKIEVGKKYKTRDGNVVRIVNISSAINECYPVGGEIVGDTSNSFYYWTTDGRYNIDQTLPHHLDIVEEFIVSVPTKFKLKEGKPPVQLIHPDWITALADVYDALSSARVYKEAWDESEVLATVEEESGRHFDPELVEIFFSSLDVLRAVQRRYQE